MDDGQGVRITKLVQDLVSKFVPATDPRYYGVVQYAMRILGSRIAPSVVQDEFHVAELIKRKLLRDATQTKSDLKQALAFAELFSRLQHKDAVRNRCAILYLLYSLSGSASAVTPLAFPSTTFCLRAVGDGLSTLPLAQPKLESQQPQPKPQEGRPLSATPPLPLAQKRIPSETTLPHEQLLRDIIYAFQGIDGRYLKYDVSQDGYYIDPNYRISPPMRDLVLWLCEVGWLYRRIQMQLHAAAKDKSLGLISQAFCACIEREIADYYRLIAVLESQLSASSADSPTASGILTLRRLFVWTQDPLYRIKQLAILMDAMMTQGLRGGRLASAVYAYGHHGDPAVRGLARHLLRQLCRPLFVMLRRWAFDGELDDPFQEFFVAAKPNVPLERMWREKYALRADMQPTFIGADLAHRILLMGKSINFLCQCCGDRDWLAEIRNVAAEADIALGLASDYDGAIETELADQIARLDRVVSEGGAVINRRLMSTLFDRYQLLDHCLALKRYLLLGQGDFIQTLMDLIGNELSKPATTLYRHNLLAVLESAIRASNAQYDDQRILERLDIRVLDPAIAGVTISPTAASGESGWDVFSLDYRVDAPLSTVLTPQCMAVYLKMFNFLWRLKRVEASLSATWRRHTTDARAALKEAVADAVATRKPSTGGKRPERPPPLQTRRNIALRAGRLNGELAAELHQSHLLRNEMLHFIYNLQYYMMFEVISCSWEELVEEIGKAQNLDQIIAAHERYLNQIVEKSFMMLSSPTTSSSAAAGVSTPSEAPSSGSGSLVTLLTRMFDLMIRFKTTQEELYNTIADENSRRKERAERIERRTKEGKWGMTSEDEEAEGVDTESATKSKLEQAAQAQLRAFREEYERLFHVLHSALSHPSSSPELKFLTFRLDFNMYYEKRRAAAAERGAGYGMERPLVADQATPVASGH